MCFEARAISAAAVLSPTERPMRVAVIVVGLVVVSTPSQASKSCMTQAEARQQFATSHLYWHERHCWDAMTSSRRVVHRVGENVQREAQRDPAAEPNNPEPKWREAMSEMLTVNEAPSPSMNWENRWVEIAQAPPTLAGDKAAQEDASANAGHRIEPMFTPMRVLLAFLDLVLTLALIGTLFRSTIYEAMTGSRDKLKRRAFARTLQLRS
jgi:hypothetical protein